MPRWADAPVVAVAVSVAVAVAVAVAEAGNRRRWGRWDIGWQEERGGRVQ